MNYNKFKIENIDIGDEVYFDDVYSGAKLLQSNFDEFWKVQGKYGNNILINLGEQFIWTINVSEIKHLKKR